MWLIYDVGDLVVLWMRRIVLMQPFRWHAVLVIATPQNPSHSMVTLVAKNPYGFLSTVSIGGDALISISGYVSLWAILAIAIPPR